MKASLSRFLVPSALGVALFLVPYPGPSGPDTGLGLLVGWTKVALGDRLALVATGAVLASGALSLLGAFRRSEGREASPDGFFDVFRVSWPLAGVRAAGAALAVMTLAGVGPDWIVGEATGGVILNELATVIVVVFVFASFLLPLLTDFGLMEFVGSLVRGLFRPLFRLPGRAAVDAAASWFGSSVVGLVITTQQWEEGRYTQREALVLALNFSVISVAFAKVVADVAQLGDRFLALYGTACVGGLVAATILPRVPPLSRKEDRYREGRTPPETVRSPASALARGYDLARRRAAASPGGAELLRRGLRTTADIWFGLLPVVMAVGVAALAVANETPIFDWLSYPLVPFVRLLGLGEAEAAAPALLVGFADQFLPVVLAQGIESDATRFVVACASITQLVYLSEVGAYLLESTLDASLADLFAVFALRTLITVPVAALAAHALF